MVQTVQRTVQTTGQRDVRDITSDVAAALSDSAMRDGVATVAVVRSTAALTTIEFEPGAVADFDRLLEHLASRAGNYAHHERWGDDNGSSHVRAALIGATVTPPLLRGTACLGDLAAAGARRV